MHFFTPTEKPSSLHMPSFESKVLIFNNNTSSPNWDGAALLPSEQSEIQFSCVNI